jgi:hypothetical protein
MSKGDTITVEALLDLVEDLKDARQLAAENFARAKKAEASNAALLEVLDECVEYSATFIPSDTLEKARAAIAAAKGKV